MSKRKLSKIVNNIQKFLKQKTTHDNAQGSDVELAMKQLGTIVYDLISTKYKSSDHSLPIEYMLINRKTHQTLHYRPLPYINENSSAEDISEYFKMLFMNNNISSTELKSAEYEMNKIFKKQSSEIENLNQEVKFLKSVRNGVNDANNKKVCTSIEVNRKLKNKGKNII